MFRGLRPDVTILLKYREYVIYIECVQYSYQYTD